MYGFCLPLHKTDLIFNSLNACLESEQDMRKQWAKTYNNAQVRKASADTLKLLKEPDGYGNMYSQQINNLFTFLLESVYHTHS